MSQRLLCIILLLVGCASSAKSQEIAFSELNYNSDSTTNSGNWVELYNYGTSSIDLGGWYLKDDNNANIFTFPSGTVIAASARLVVVNDVPKFTEQFPTVSNYLGGMDFSFGNDFDEVRLFDNSGLLKLYMQYSDSLPWPEAADGTGRTLELLNPLIIPDDPSNWFVGCMKGSPGKAFIPCNDPLVFDEINYNSDTLLDSGDWIELYNRSAGGINLTGWSFKDSNDDNPYFFPTNTQIAAGARLVLVHDLVKFQARHPNVTNYVGPFDFNLSNDGELTRLFNYQGKLTFSVVYDDDGDWPEGADGDDYTLELLSPAGNMNSSGNWFTGCPEGSPGFAYNSSCNVGIQSASSAPFNIITGFSDNLLTVQFNGSITENYSLSVFNIVGQVVYHQESSENKSSINTGEFAPGIYVLSIKMEGMRWSQEIFIH